MKITIKLLIVFILVGFLSFNQFALALGEDLVSTPEPTPVIVDVVSPTPVPEVVATPTPEVVSEPISQILPSDTTPPTISGVAEASLAINDATIIWTTDELATSRLKYGLSTSYDQEVTLGASAALVHTGLILGLSSNTKYYYCIYATDLSGNTSQSCGHSFTTLAESVELDSNPPTVSLIDITSVSQTSVTISWTTDEVSNAEIEYGTTAGYGSTTPLNTDLSTSHSVTITGLTPDTEYHYRVRSSDEIGNISHSTDNTFTTSPLVIENSSTSGSGTETTLTISSVEVTHISSSSATITWNTSEATDSQVEYGDSELLGSFSPLNSSLSTSHSVTLSGLESNTNYIFKVKSKTVGSSTSSSLHEFNTLAEPIFVAEPAHISSVTTSSIGATSVTVHFTTDVATTGQVQYGITTIYGETVSANTSTTDHMLNLTDLTDDTTYHYRVKAVTVAGDITYSSDHTFTTLAVAQTTTGETTSPSSNSTSTQSTPVSISSPQATSQPSPSATAGTATPAPDSHVPPAAITDLSTTAEDETSASLFWHVASDHADAAIEYDIRMSTSLITDQNFSSASKVQSSLIVAADLQPTGTKRTYMIVGLEPGPTYYFALKSKYQHSEWSDRSNVAGVTTSLIKYKKIENPSFDTGGSRSSGGGGWVGSHYNTMSPTLIHAAGEHGQIELTWSNSNQPSFVRTVIVKKEDGYPNSPQDGLVIYEGRAETFTDLGLTNGKMYYYSFYSYDHAKQYSKAVNVSLAPKQGVEEVKLHKNPVVIPLTTHDHFVRELRLGNKDIEVEHLQQVLFAEGELKQQKHITGYFGGITQAALKKFQARHKLPQTGITDVATRMKLTAVSGNQAILSIPEDIALFTKDLRFGNRNPEVEQLQQFLIYEGSYPNGTVNGVFDRPTRNAVIVFQKKYNIRPPVGYVGPKTRHQIQFLNGL